MDGHLLRQMKDFLKHDKDGRFLAYALVLIVLLATFIRVWRVNDMLVFADEIHSLHCAVHHGYGWILTHFAKSDACIPLTFYNKLMMEVSALTEWTMRMPSIIAGNLLLIFLSFFVFRYLSAPAAIITVGLIAFSPYFVYLTREARPYIIMTFFFTIAVMMMFSWGKRLKLQLLYGVAIFSALSLFFHPIAAPAVAVLWLYPISLGLFSEKVCKHEIAKHFALGVGLFLLIAVALLGPAMLSFLQGVSSKSAKGTADLITLRNAMMLIPGIPIHFPIWAWWGIAGIGFFVCLQKFWQETLWIGLMLAIQIAVLFVVQPRLMQIPWVLLRYVIHLIPFFIILFANGFVFIGKMVCPSALYPRFISVGLLVLVFGFGFYHLSNYNYGVREPYAYNVHPMWLFADKKKHALNQEYIPDFYKNNRHFVSAQIIYESPLVVTFPLYGVYQAVHRQQIRTVAVGDGHGQGVFATENGVRFKSTRAEKDLYKTAEQHSSLVVIHKNIKSEIRSIFNKIKTKNSLVAEQMVALDYLFTDKVLSNLFRGVEAYSAPKSQAQLIYEDRWVRVLRLKKASRPRGN